MSNSIGIFNTLIDKISGVKELQYYLNVTNLNIKILLLGETHKTGKCFVILSKIELNRLKF